MVLVTIILCGLSKKVIILMKIRQVSFTSQIHSNIQGLILNNSTYKNAKSILSLRSYSNLFNKIVYIVFFLKYSNFYFNSHCSL